MHHFHLTEYFLKATVASGFRNGLYLLDILQNYIFSNKQYFLYYLYIFQNSMLCKILKHLFTSGHTACSYFES